MRRAAPVRPPTVHYMTEAMRRFFADRSEHLGDPDFVKLPMTPLLAQVHRAAAGIDRPRARHAQQPDQGRRCSTGTRAVETTHYTVADDEGNVAAVTYTLNGGFGSKVTATGLGFLLNNEMDDFASKPGEANMYGPDSGRGQRDRSRARRRSRR